MLIKSILAAWNVNESFLDQLTRDYIHSIEVTHTRKARVVPCVA